MTRPHRGYTPVSDARGGDLGRTIRVVRGRAILISTR